MYDYEKSILTLNESFFISSLITSFVYSLANSSITFKCYSLILVLLQA